jgi:hypothetical protein
MDKTRRQNIQMLPWKAKKPSHKDPIFRTTAAIKPEIAKYIADCFATGVEPELFFGVWAYASKEYITLGIMLPYKEPTKTPGSNLDA